MKYMIFNFECLYQNFLDHESIINIGDSAMIMSIEKLYREMGIPSEKIIKVTTAEIFDYTGEYALCPMATCTDVFRGKMIHMISDKVIPVFIGFSINATSLVEADIKYLKKWEPIGCRDEQTLDMLRGYGIEAYLHGCMSATLLPVRCKLETQQKVFFVDVPKEVKKYIPEDIKKDIVFIKQEIKLEALPEGETPRSFAEHMIEKYAREARLVVTSRFHGAIIPMALGIPVIITNENYTYRFSWLKKLLPFYTRVDFDKINWNPEVVDFEDSKKLMIRIAKKRITETYNKYCDICDQSHFLEEKSDETPGLIDYYWGAIDYIKNNWPKDSEIKYAFWGVNNNAEYIYEFIQNNYTNAKLVKIYDTFKNLHFMGIDSEPPSNMSVNDNIFVFVTTFIAGYVAKQFFAEKGIDSSKYYLCEREYVTAEDL